MNKKIELDKINVTFDQKPLLKDFSISFTDNSFYTILGPSGCGKTTILNLIAGFIYPDSGEVLISGKNVTDIKPANRRVNTVFQDYSLFEHLNIFENIAFGLRLKKVRKKDINLKVNEVIKMLKLEGLEKRYPNELSGGQKQRVAIARSIIMEPEVLLLDEPLSALDYKLRQEIQYMLKNIQKKLRITFIFVTHDQEEALLLSDYIYVLKDGIIMQKGKPKEIYDEPKNEFVAKFIGTSNIFDGQMLADYNVYFLNSTFKCVDKGFKADEKVKVVIRPEDIIVSEEKTALKVKIHNVLFKGLNFEYDMLDQYGNKWIMQTTKEYLEEEEIYIDVEPEGIHVFKE